MLFKIYKKIPFKTFGLTTTKKRRKKLRLKLTFLYMQDL